ncbi:hypothetical protein LHA31_04710 [Carnobacterium viridans]|nr:hypothetical protein [Carnobacterium viridans]UDE96034.1 hypothetical protein LHA31_04710 [Carnobacterium viridans]
MSKKEQVLLEELDSEKPKNLKKAVHYFFELLMLQKRKPFQLFFQTSLAH